MPGRKKVVGGGENLAVKILHDQGYLVLERNWRCRFGEIDLVAWDKQNRILAFVEVKSRYSDLFGGARWAINAQKYRRMRALVGCWLAYPHSDQKIVGYKQQAKTVRLDLIAVDIAQSGPVKVTFTKGI